MWYSCGYFLLFKFLISFVVLVTRLLSYPCLSIATYCLVMLHNMNCAKNSYWVNEWMVVRVWLQNETIKIPGNPFSSYCWSEVRYVLVVFGCWNDFAQRNEMVVSWPPYGITSTNQMPDVVSSGSEHSISCLHSSEPNIALALLLVALSVFVTQNLIWDLLTKNLGVVLFSSRYYADRTILMKRSTISLCRRPKKRVMMWAS